MENQLLYKYTILPVFILAIVLSACSEDPPALKEAPAKPRSRVTQVQGFVVQAAPLDQKLQATGTFLSNESVQLTSEVAGKITSLNFCEGCPVRKGQIIARIDRKELLARQQKIQVDLDQAKEDLERSTKLLAVNAVPSEEVSQAKSKLAGYEADIQVLNVQLDKTLVRAPFSGRAGLREISIGAYINPGMPITTIRQTNPIKVEFAVPERYAKHIQKEATVWISLPNRQDTYTAKVFAIDPGIDPSTRSLKVRARMNNQEGTFIPGGFCSVFYQVYQNENTFNIPAEAVLPELSGQKVMVAAGGKATSRPVSLGIRNENKVQIVDGLSEGDTILTTGLLILTDGMPIAVEVQNNLTTGEATNANLIQ